MAIEIESNAPGIQPSNVKTMFNSKQQVQPSFNNTVNGGKMMAMMRSRISPGSIVVGWVCLRE